MKKQHFLLLNFRMLILLLLPISPNLYSQQCSSINIVQNNSFESTSSGSNCTNPNYINNSFISNGCVNNWFSANNTPDIYSSLTPVGSTVTITAPDGSNFAYIGTLGSPECVINEGFFQNINIQPGKYYINFKYYNIYNDYSTGILQLFLANNLQNINTNNNPCLNITKPWQSIGDIVISNQAGWQDVYIEFEVPNNNPNNQLVFLAGEITNGFLVGIGIDDIHLSCLSELSTDQSNIYIGSGEYQFEATQSNYSANLTITEWCWDFGDGSSSSQQNPSHTYTSEGVYNVTLTIKDNAGCTRKNKSIVNYSSCNAGSKSIVIGNPDPSLGAVVWANLTDKHIDVDVIIPPGQKLYIWNSSIKMAETCKFIVMNGGYLLISNSAISSNCGSWAGIFVWGVSTFEHLSIAGVINYTLPNLPLNGPGFVRINNNSTLSNMDNGIFAQRGIFDPRNEAVFEQITGNTYNYSLASNFFGGLVKCEDSHFINNLNSSVFFPYKNSNYSSFSHCTFDSPNASSSNGLTIIGTDNILIKSCTFSNLRGYGITNIDAGITVLQSNFDNNDYGTYTSGLTGYPSFITKIGDGSDLNKNTYDNNLKTGLTATLKSNIEVSNNEFNNHTYYDPLEQSYSFATHFINDPIINIQKNHFKNNRAGIFVNTYTPFNTPVPLGKIIFCNIHDQDRTGLLIRGRNYGLRFLYNKYDTGLIDVGLSPLTGGDKSTVFKYQGQTGAPANNIFTLSNSINIYNIGSDQLFYYFPPLILNDAILSDRVIPNCDRNSYNDPNCVWTNEFINQVPTLSNLDCPTTPPSPFNCRTKNCLDSLKTRLNLLNLQISNGLSQNEYDRDNTSVQVNSDWFNLLSVWYSAKDYNDIESMLNFSESSFENISIKIGYFLKRNKIDSAIAYINLLPNNTDEQKNIIITKRILADFWQNPVYFQSNRLIDSTLIAIAHTESQSGILARDLYLAIHKTIIDLPFADILQFYNTNNRSIDSNTTFKNNEVIIYPSPSSDYFKITNYVNKSIKKIEIIDINGVVISQYMPSVSYNISQLSSGLYVIRINFDDSTSSYKKIIIQH